MTLSMKRYFIGAMVFSNNIRAVYHLCVNQDDIHC